MSDMDFKDTLAHFGVKGMKWGVTRENTPAGTSRSSQAKLLLDQSTNKGEKKVTSEQIFDARARHNARMEKIVQADKDFRLATTKKGKDEALATVAKYGKEIRDTDDERIASKMTKGEKWLIVGAGTVIFPGVGTAIGLAAVAGNNLSTRKGENDKIAEKKK